MSSGQSVVIVGGGPAGKAAAGAYRDSGGRGPVTMLSREGRAPYNRPPLTKEYLRGEASAEDLPLEPEDWYRQRDITLVLDADVIELNLEEGRVKSRDGRTWTFDACLLATGSRPLVPDVPGSGLSGVHTIRRVVDSDSLARLAGERVVVVGSGFIGCEAAASLAMRGSDVSLATLEAAPQLGRLGEAVAERIAGWLAGYGVSLLGEAELSEITAASAGDVVARFADGRRLHGAGVVLALGIERNDELAKAAGMRVEDGLPVDPSMRSEDGRLLAAGDVAVAENPSAGRRLRVEHWGEALTQGAIAGRTMAGVSARWVGAPGFWSTIGERTIKYAGWGDGWDATRLEPGADGSFTAWYGHQGELAAVLTYGRDDDFERGRSLIESGAPWG